MKLLPVTTAHNVVIDYQMATLLERIFAWLIDIIIIYFLILFFYLFVSFVFWNGSTVGEYLEMLVIMPIALFYHPAFELFNNGRSPGKMALGIRVVTIYGEIPTMSEYLVRWAFRPIDILLTSGSLAAILISSTSRNQRLGDLIANTTVIKAKPAFRFSLNDILKLDVPDYKPEYPEVVSLTEKEAVMIKRVLERRKTNPNRATDEAAKALFDHISKTVKPKDSNQTIYAFFSALLKDYVILNR